VAGLPNADRRWIPDAKILEYLLNSTSPKGKSRHDFLVGCGFSRANWQMLKSALMHHATTSVVRLARQDQWGDTYSATGPLNTPDGRNPSIVAYWIIRADDPRPQLTSVVPQDDPRPRLTRVAPPSGTII